MKTAKELCEAIFAVPRMLRSPEYRDGALAAFRCFLEHEKATCPHSAGTAECDAWWAGYREGMNVVKASQS
jgi:hypothetical protein